ncbi:MAG: response regulator [Imperialibacter sp.]|uniref:response regulator n=1 Tax=Imperialibacter sp. TaxID=2038411 RepID=UPI0032EE0CFE
MQNRKILVIEDETKVAAKIERVLRGMGAIDVRIASSSGEAIAMAQFFLPDLIIVSQNIAPENNAIFTVNSILEFHTPEIIYLLDNHSGHLITGALETHPANFVVKPFGKQQLEIAVKIALRKSK